MKEVLINFPNQIEAASKVGQSLKLPVIRKLSNIVVCGMGGSAISGDLLFHYLTDEISIPIFVNRDYDLPNFVNQNSIVFISSYSGNTEETISAYRQAVKRTKCVLCITSGGKLSEEDTPYILRIPEGYQPRCALGWLFIPMIIVLTKLGIVSDKKKELNETVSLLYKLSKEFKLFNSRPFLIAKNIIGKFPIIYSDTRFSPIAKRWVTQLNENAKVLAHFNVFSELNHNEIVGFSDSSPNLSVIILKDREYNPRIRRRIEITKKIISLYTEIHEVESYGDSLLSRFFSLIYFGDWMSYWLAILRGVDPTPIEHIERLKKELLV